jgi:AGCS family alanine or glycine:cation symporter
VFLVLFTGVAGWVFYQNLSAIPSAFALIFQTAFTGHAAVGAFAGSGVLLTMSSGIKRACYSGDIGIGYASIIHSESAEAVPEKQAALGIVGIFIDTFIICTISVLLIVVTGLWNQGINENFVVEKALSAHIPYIALLWPFFIFLLGYSTLIAFFSAGRKAAEFLWPRYGSISYSIYAALAFLIFSFVGTSAHVMTIMSMTGALLLLLNLYGIFQLRKTISFTLPSK